jgi:serine/threonine protein kinase
MSWAQRHAQLIRLIESSRVSQAREEALHAAGLITQTDDNAASAVASHQASLRIIGKGGQEEILGRLLDASLAVLWSAPTYSVDSNEVRLAACSSLKSILNVALSESNRDLSSITCLESNREGTVELVRCRLDKKIYVLKSTTKGAAKRGYRSNAPVTERRLLSLARKTHLETTRTVFTPTCIAAFQSPGSLHILMDYCPAGDLYHFLESAGEAPIINEARNKSGGLLTERYVRRYAIDMVAAISWLHEQGFMHR